MGNGNDTNKRISSDHCQVVVVTKKVLLLKNFLGRVDRTSYKVLVLNKLTKNYHNKLNKEVVDIKDVKISVPV